jgi:hypothetical protein
MLKFQELIREFPMGEKLWEIGENSFLPRPTTYSFGNIMLCGKIVSCYSNQEVFYLNLNSRELKLGQNIRIGLYFTSESCEKC